MAVFKCKMCGGALEIDENQTTAVCEYCGTQQTLPRLDDERRVNLYDRANHLRRNNEYDKAAAIYEQMLNEDGSDAEAYWSLVLCRYGIEYVEDPATRRRVPTVNRAQFTSVFDDENYKKALANADGISKTLYEREAAAINELQKGILAISQKEEPFDVFICYKETDNNGRRTPESVLANDLYHQLTSEGFKVFFSRITLEDKLGSAYEPYIFAALNSAKVMVAIGTRPEHFQSVWVKNEWSRYLSLVKQSGGKKVLIPAYKDMDPYDLPDEFSHLQAQDMGKLGFMQDLIRGIKKLTAVEKVPVAKETFVMKNEGGSNLTALLKRGKMALEDSEWEKADGFFEQVLNLDAECADAYWGIALAQQQCCGRKEFIARRKAPLNSLKPEILTARGADVVAINAAVARYTKFGYMEDSSIRSIYEYSFDYPSLVSSCAAARANEERYWSGDKQLSKAVRFIAGNDTKLEQIKQEILSAFDDRISVEKEKDVAAKKRLLEAYPAHLQRAEERCLREYTEQHAHRLGSAIAKEKEADALVEKADASGKQTPYAPATAAYTEAREQFQSLVPDAGISEHIDRCYAQLAQIGARVTSLRTATAKKIKNIALTAIAAVIALVILAIFVFIPAVHYADAEKALATGHFDEARTEFIAAENYKGAASRVPECYYAEGEALLTEGDYTGADAAFASAGSYNDAKERIGEGFYLHGEALLAEDDYVAAVVQFGKAGSYGDASSRARTLWNDIAVRNTIAAGWSHTVGLRVDGTVVATEYTGARKDYLGQCDVSDWTDIVAIAASDNSTVGLRVDGTAVATGSTDCGICDVTDWTDIVAIAAGNIHTVGLRADGTVVATEITCDEDYNYGQCDVSDWTDIVAIAAGRIHTVGLRADGTVVAVGDNDEGQCDVSGWTDIVAIAAGRSHTVGLRADGTVVATEYTDDVLDYGQCNVSGWTDIVAIAAGYDHTVGLRANGTVVAAGSRYGGSCDVADWTDIVAIAAGFSHTVGLRTDGTVVATEHIENYYSGECDVSGWTDIKLPKKI